MAASFGPRLPTRRRDWALTGRVVGTVLRRPAYGILAGVTALLALAGFVVAGNATVVLDLVVGGDLPVVDRLRLLARLAPFGGGVGPAGRVAVVAVAALLGVDVALLASHAREHDLSLRAGAGGSAGVLLATLGAGCGLCGASLLAGLLAMAGVAGGLVLLPFHGLEVLAVAAALVVLSIHWLAAGMHGGMRRDAVEGPGAE